MRATERSGLGLLLAAVLAAPAPGQGRGVLGRDNTEFARRLFETGYPDLADGLCKAIQASNPTASDTLAVQALAFEIEVKAVDREPDLTKRIERLKQVIAGENAFIKDNARTSVADFVRTNLPTVYVELSSTITALKDRETDVEKRRALIEDGQLVFEEGKKALVDRQKRFEQQIPDGVGDQEYAARQHLISLYNLGCMEYQHAQLYAQDSPEAKERLGAALKIFRQLGFDYPDSPQNFLGIIYQGKCNEELGKTKDAIAAYEDVIAIREGFETDEDGVFLIGDLEGNFISGATRNLVQLLTRLARQREAIAVAEDYLRRTPDPLFQSAGPEVLAAKAEAEVAANDITAASASAQLLVDFDPQGWAGRKGREILGRLPVFNLSPDKILKIAETAAGRGDFNRALDLARRAREAVRGARDEGEVGGAAFMLIGSIYRAQDKLFEASAAFDLGAELYPNGSRAPEALNAAVAAYRKLAKDERSRFYANRADKQNLTLAQRYPNHPLAANAGIYQGLRREDDGDYDGARDFYSKVPQSSPSYYEAQYRLANATYSQAKNMLVQGQRVEAQALLTKADQQYNAAIELLNKAKEETLDTTIQQRLSSFLISCRMGLAALYIDTGKAPQVQGLLAGLEKKVNDPDAAANIWSLRIRALQAEGKVDEAVKLFESVIAGSSASAGVASAAGVLARALDGAAVEAAARDPKRADDLWKKAAYYYSTSVKPALDGSAAMRGSDILEVARRLYVIGLFQNRVPEGQATFVDWQGTIEAPELWEEVTRIYERLDSLAPSYEVSIERARSLAILARIPEAEEIYARLFDQVTLFQPGAKSFDATVIESRPELVSAYLEWGVTSHLVGNESKDQSRLDRAAEIYQRVINNTTDAQRLWWQARYFQIKLLSDRGDYDTANQAIKNVKRNTDPEYDKGKFGFKDKFVEMEKELSRKVFNK